MKITFVNRKKNGGVSIEELFKDLNNNLEKKNVLVKTVELPFCRPNPLNILKNIFFVSKLTGIIHITGDVHYAAINPFKKLVLTVHDTASTLKGNWVSRFVKKLLWFWLPSIFVQKITVVSEFSKSELVRIIPWARTKITVIHNPVNSHLEFSPKSFNKKCPRILHLGTNSNKNLENTITALRGINCILVIVGVMNVRQQTLLLQNGITHENYYNLEYYRVKELLETSDLVSFISFYEGFGLPIVEAQKVGRALITGTRASLPEIAGTGAHFVDADNVDDIKAGFIKLIDDDGYRDDLISKGIQNVQRFEINEIANKYVELYDYL